METVSESEVQELQREVNRLQQEIAELNKKQSDIKYAQLQRSRCPTMEDRYIPNVSSNKELPFTSTLLKEMLSVNDNLNGVTFLAIEKRKVTSDLYQLDAECKSYNLLFRLSCQMMTEPDESITVKTLKVTFQDASRVEEVMSFINSCLRGKNLQELLSGLAHYAALCNVRETVVSWLCSDCPSALHVNRSVDNGAYLIEMYGNQNRELYLTCNWNIQWQKRNHMMGPYLKISVHRKDFPREGQQYARRICEKPPCGIEAMKEAWEEIIDCIAKLK